MGLDWEKRGLIVYPFSGIIVYGEFYKRAIYIVVIMVSLYVYLDAAYAKNSNTGNWYLFHNRHVEQVPK